MESILTSIKKMLGISEEYEHFDADIIMHINSVFMTLNQLGVGPSEGFYIEDDEAYWTDFIPDMAKLQAVKTYVYLKVRLLFDPSSLGSATLAAYERQIQELEWRMNIIAESSKVDNNSVDMESGTTVKGVVVDCWKLNVRSKPRSEASLVCVLDVNDRVSIDMNKSEGDWYYIYTADGSAGYCLKSNIKVYS